MNYLNSPVIFITGQFNSRWWIC